MVTWTCQTGNHYELPAFYKGEFNGHLRFLHQPSASKSSKPLLAANICRAGRLRLAPSGDSRSDLRVKCGMSKKNKSLVTGAESWVSTRLFNCLMIPYVVASLSFMEQVALLVTPESKSWLEREVTGQSWDGFAWAQSLWALFFNLFIQFPVGVCNFNQ